MHIYYMCIDSACKSHEMDINKISKVTGIILIFMTLELWGHYRTNSLSLLADSLHLLVDISSFLISILCLKISKKKKNSKFNFGYARVEVLGGIFSIILIWIAVAYLMIESLIRTPKIIEPTTFLVIAIIGLLVNIVCAYILHSSCSKTINLRAAYVHVIGDILQSVGVIIASCITYFTNLVIADIICTIFFAILVLVSTIFVLKDAVSILLECNNFNFNNYKNFILNIENIIKIKDYKIWSIGVNSHAIMINIETDYILINEYNNIKSKIYNKLERDFDVINIQIDTV